MISFYLSAVSESVRDKVTFIYNEFYGVMCHVASQYVDDRYDIEDIVHDSMLKIIDHLDKISIDDSSKMKAFCTVIVKHKAIDFLRTRNNQNISIEEEEIMISEETNPLNIIVDDEIHQKLLKAIDSLNDTYKEVCILKYVHGLKEREIASVLDLPPKTVNVRIFRGKQILKRALNKEELYV